MKNFFKFIDLYGIKFNFRINQKDNFKSLLGGVFTIMTVTVLFIFGFYFGQDFYYGTNPIIYSTTFIPEKYDDPYHLTLDNFLIAWRVENIIKSPTNLTGIIHPVTYYRKYRKNKQGDLVVNFTKIMPNRKCTEENAKLPEFNKYNKIDNWYCYDLRDHDYTLGGFFDGDYVDQIQTVFYLCSDAGTYSESNPNCTKIKDYKKFETDNGGLAISIMYPEFYLAADDLQNPLRIVYKNYYYYFGIASYKIDRFFFNKVSIRDDRGWIFEDIRENSVLSYNRFSADQGTFEFKEGTISHFYGWNIYVEKSSKIIKRSFMKIQDLFAKIGGLIKMVMTLFSLINSFFSYHNLQTFIFQELFAFPERELDDISDFHDGDKREMILGSNITKNKNSSLYFKSKANLKKPEDKLSKDFQSNACLNEKMNKNLNNSNFSSTPLEKIDSNPKHKYFQESMDKELHNPNYKQSKSKKDLNSMTKKNNFIGNSSSFLAKKPIMANSSKKNASFSTCFQLESIFCRRKSRNAIKKYQAYFYLKNFFEQRLDIVNYIKTLNNFEVVKQLSFNKTQNDCFRHFKKPNIFNEEEMVLFGIKSKRNFTEERNRIIEYFKEKGKSGVKSELDKKISKYLNEAIKIF